MASTPTENTPLVVPGASRAAVGESRARVRDAWNIQELDLKRIFEEFDTDKSNALDRNEFKALLTVYHKGIPPSEEDLDFMIKVADKDHNSVIDFGELSFAMRTWWVYTNMSELWPEGQALFEEYDKDKNGKLDQSELRALLQDLNGGKAVSDDEVKEVMEASGTDGQSGSYKVENLKRAIASWVSKIERMPTPQSEIAKATVQSAVTGLIQDLPMVAVAPALAVHERLDRHQSTARLMQEAKEASSKSGVKAEMARPILQDPESQKPPSALPPLLAIAAAGGFFVCLSMVPSILAIVFGSIGNSDAYVPCGAMFPGALAKLTLAYGVLQCIVMFSSICIYALPAFGCIQVPAQVASLVIAIMLFIETWQDHRNPANCYPTLLTFAWIFYCIIPIVALGTVLFFCCCGCCLLCLTNMAADGDILRGAQPASMRS